MANWEYHIELKPIWKDYEEEKIDVIEAGKRVAQELRNSKVSMKIDSYLLDQLDDIIFSFENLSEDEEDFNGAMQELYDWGDLDMPTPPGKMQRKLAWIAVLL